MALWNNHYRIMPVNQTTPDYQRTLQSCESNKPQFHDAPIHRRLNQMGGERRPRHKSVVTSFIPYHFVLTADYGFQDLCKGVQPHAVVWILRFSVVANDDGHSTVWCKIEHQCFGKIHSEIDFMLRDGLLFLTRDISIAFRSYSGNDRQLCIFSAW